MLNHVDKNIMVVEKENRMHGRNTFAYVREIIEKNVSKKEHKYQNDKQKKKFINISLFHIVTSEKTKFLN